MELLVKLWTLTTGMTRHRKNIYWISFLREFCRFTRIDGAVFSAIKNESYIHSTKNNKMQIRSIVFMVSVLLYNHSDRTSDQNNDFLVGKKRFGFSRPYTQNFVNPFYVKNRVVCHCWLAAHDWRNRESSTYE